MQYVLALDQGTTSSRALLFDRRAQITALSQLEFPQHFPSPGLVEHDAMDIWRTELAAARAVLREADAKPEDVAAIGVTNQRETTIIWDRSTGEPIAPAIVWQDRRTDERCAFYRREGFEPVIAGKTGLRLDPYSRQRRSSGSSTMFPALASAQSAGSSLSAPSTAGSSGISLAALRM